MEVKEQSPQECRRLVRFENWHLRLFTKQPNQFPGAAAVHGGQRAGPEVQGAKIKQPLCEQRWEEEVLGLFLCGENNCSRGCCSMEAVAMGYRNSKDKQSV